VLTGVPETGPLDKGAVDDPVKVELLLVLPLTLLSDFDDVSAVLIMTVLARFEACVKSRTN
jgi:hypothetical protein